ncbi:MAG: immunoglobulin domain-containing protein, partial [Bacteroidales bacterium]
MKTIKLVATVLFFVTSVLVYSQAPEIVNNPGNKTVCAGSEVSFIVEATGAEPLTYNWFQDSSSIGTNSDTLTFASTDESNEGTYFCVVSNGEGSDTTNDFQLIVVTGTPVIIDQTPDGTFCEGDSTGISVTSDGESMSYNWEHNGSPISNFSPSINFSSISPSDAGTYHHIVSNACGEDDTEINIDVIALPQITQGPQPVTVCEGEDAEFNIEATGSDLEYQWLQDGSPISGENDSILVLNNVQSPFSGMLSCRVFNSCDTVTSGQVSLTVNTLPEVTAHPLSHNLCIGTDTTLVSTATGTPPISMSWYENESIIPGSDTTSLSVTAEPGDTTYYYAVFMNMCGSVYSDSAMIVPFSPPVITQQPVDQTVCLHDTVELSIKVNGTEPIYYQWQRNGVDVDDSNCSGTDASNLEIEAINEGQSGTYTCIVWNECGDTVSDEAEVEIIMPPNIISQPDAFSVCEGDTASTEMLVEGDEPMDFYWVNNDAVDTVSNDETLVFNNITEYQQGTYYAIVSNQCENVFSDEFEVEVFTYPEFTLQPEDLDICHGDSAALVVNTDGTEPVNHMWFKNQSALTSETDTILEFNPAETLETGYYMCVADNICGVTESDEVHVNIGTTPAITWHPVGQDLCENETLI